MAISFFKKTALLILILCCSIGSGYAQSPQATFDSANDKLKAGQYQQAIALYKNLESQNTVSGALFLNLGICYQRIDSLGRAKYYFLKASRFEETQDQAKQALNFVEGQFSRQSAVLPKLPWDIATDWLRNNIGATNLLLIGIILLNLGILVFIIRWFVSWYPNYLKYGGYAITGLAIIVMCGSLYTRYVSTRYSTAVMVKKKIPVVEKPQKNSSLVSQAFEGYTFTVDNYKSKSHPGWAYVRMSNGLYGWIPNDEIMIL
ncbi:MAG TPA: hypothetical protein VJ964_03495 [Balneolaceae bacterium]|nr:hypothetical protein [Balneolaceae bacterium]